MTLQEAGNLAREWGLLSRDYYEMSDHEKGQLIKIMDQTKWRQSASSAARGHSRTYAFYLSVKKGRGFITK